MVCPHIVCLYILQLINDAGTTLISRHFGIKSAKCYLLLDRRARRRLDFKDSQEELNISKRRTVDDCDGDSDDDHMESSRIVTPSPPVMADTQKPFSILSALNKYLRMWASFVLPRKSFPKVCFIF